MKIHLLGDSIVQSGQGSKFYSGWGDYLSAFLKSSVEVRNYARGGRSSRSFLNEGRFCDNGQFTVEDTPFGLGSALPAIEAGDYVLIQFMHNDDDTDGVSYRVNKQVILGEPDEKGVYPTVKPEESMLVSTDYWIPGYPECLYAEGKTEAQVQTIMETIKELLAECGQQYYPYDCGATYKGYLKYYADRIHEKGAIPILVTAPVRHCFIDEKIVPLLGHHGGKDAYHEYPYVEAVKQLGDELGVTVIDLFAATKKMYELLGSEDSSYLHTISIDEGSVNEAKVGNESPVWPDEYDRRRKEKDFRGLDTVHSNRYGAFLHAALIVGLLHEQNLLKEWGLEVPSKYEQMPEHLIPRKAELEALCIKANTV